MKENGWNVWTDFLSGRGKKKGKERGGDLPCPREKNSRNREIGLPLVRRGKKSVWQQKGKNFGGLGKKKGARPMSKPVRKGII